jgi:NAD(P)-dependent dehydrogenase (short-subunit alcohol dehydrogenase family)
MKTICAWLAEDAGINVGVTSLTSYVSRMRRRQGTNMGAHPRIDGSGQAQITDQHIALIPHRTRDEQAEYLGKMVPLGHADMPDDIANAILFLVSDEASFVLGAEFVVDRGWR